MEYRTLGRTGVQVSSLCLGAMNFGHQYDTTREDSTAMIRAALDAGINFIDTADVYSHGESEEIVGEAVAGCRDEVVVATKCHHPMADKLNHRGNTRSWIIRACEDSLRRLGTDYIDLYQVHRTDPLTAIEDTMSALSDLVHQGKVRMIGCCTFPPSEIVEAHWASERYGYERFRSNQPPYSIFTRGIERESLGVCQRYGMGVLTWSPLNSGWLTGKIRRDQPRPDSPRNQVTINRRRDESDSELGQPPKTYGDLLYDPSLPHNERKYALVEELLALADGAGVSLVELAIAFVLRHPAVTSAIIGPRTMAHLESQLPAVDVTLDDDVLDRIDQLVTPGTDVATFDAGYMPPEIVDAWRRRR